MMIDNRNIFNFNVAPIQNNNSIATINIESQYVDPLYLEAINSQKNYTHTYGFSKGGTPLSYIQDNFKAPIFDHLKEVLFMYCASNFLYKSIIDNKILIPGEPILLNIDINDDKEALFKFGFTNITIDQDNRWKKLVIKAPDRKNYKDLDKQADLFIKTEVKSAESYNNEISIGDMVCFDIQLCGSNQNPILPNYKNQLWLRISDEETDHDIQEIFLGKKLGDKFCVYSNYLQKYFSNNLSIKYLFDITIVDILPDNHFSFDNFQHHFQLKTNKDIHQKLIEVFSFRNDISLRRETAEAVLKSILKQYFISIPPYLLEEQKNYLLKTIYNNPDYNVYKAQNGFNEKIKALAEKQLKVAIIIDAISYQENIQVTHKDIVSYLNLFKRSRSKEFVYFDLPILKSEGQEMPISTEFIKRYCLREKTLNFVINTISKRKEGKFEKSR